MRDKFSIHDLEADLGLGARLTLIQNAGGQQRYVPSPANAHKSTIAEEFGLEITLWLAARFGGSMIVIPSRRGMKDETDAALLRAAILDAGLTDPIRSYNDIAGEFGVTERHVRQIRADLRREQPPAPIPLFDRVP